MTNKIASDIDIYLFRLNKPPNAELAIVKLIDDLMAQTIIEDL